jgi:hypothetical protein
MQRHGGQTRPALPSAKPSATPARENADDNNRSNADDGPAPDKSSESKG